MLKKIFNAILIRLVGKIKISLLLKIQGEQHHNLSTKTVNIRNMMWRKAPCSKGRSKNVNLGTFYQSGRDVLRLGKSLTDKMKKNLTAYNQDILRLKVTKILKIWLKKFFEFHPRAIIFNKTESKNGSYRHRRVRLEFHCRHKAGLDFQDK
jgi:hypothetical protein